MLKWKILERDIVRLAEMNRQRIDVRLAELNGLRIDVRLAELNWLSIDMMSQHDKNVVT